MKKRWIIGTRGSKLALKQTDMVIGQLQLLYPDFQSIVKIIKTTGDTIWDKPLQTIGEKGLFVKEIEDALLQGEIDLAVHSMKDLPTDLPEGLTIAAILRREDPRDAFISPAGRTYSDIGEGSRVGTNSLRRKSQLLNLKRSVVIIPIRGNIDTRIKKIETLSLDGIILALAGVRRMGFEDLVSDILPLDTMVPPSGQGAIGIETRSEQVTLDFLARLDDPVSHNEVEIERRLQTMIGGGCSVPLGINASIMDGELILRASYGDEEGAALTRVRETGGLDRAEDVVLAALTQIKGSMPSS